MRHVCACVIALSKIVVGVNPPSSLNKTCFRKHQRPISLVTAFEVLFFCSLSFLTVIFVCQSLPPFSALFLRSLYRSRYSVSIARRLVHVIFLCPRNGHFNCHTPYHTGLFILNVHRHHWDCIFSNNAVCTSADKRSKYLLSSTLWSTHACTVHTHRENGRKKRCLFSHIAQQNGRTTTFFFWRNLGESVWIRFLLPCQWSRGFFLPLSACGRSQSRQFFSYHTFSNAKKNDGDIKGKKVLNDGNIADDTTPALVDTKWRKITRSLQSTLK